MLQAKRDERAKEENERRAKLKSVADKVKAEKDARFTASMKIINKAKVQRPPRRRFGPFLPHFAQQLHTTTHTTTHVLYLVLMLI